MDNSRLNPEFQKLEVDYLYHLGLDSGMDLPKEFGDIKYVIFTRSFSNADYFANQFAEQFYGLNNLHIQCKTIAKDERYHIYKIANTLIVSHGVGFPSMLICLNEVVKLMWHAQVSDFKFLRLSPGGGVNVADNSVIIATEALNQQFQPKWSNIEFGDYYDYPTPLSAEVANALLDANPNMKLLSGKVMASSCFYNGQARLNGAVAVSYDKQQRDDYLNRAYQAGIRGIDMESSCFAAFCNELQIPGGIVIAALADRLKDNDSEPSLMVDSDKLSPALHKAGQVIINYILKNA